MTDLRLGHKTDSSFFEWANLELKRAERYRFFVSLIVLDLSFIRSLPKNQNTRLSDNLLQTVRGNIRVIDNILAVKGYRLILLLPETSRQDAEIVARRVSDLIRSNLTQQAGNRLDITIPMEMASYPDAAGAKSVIDLLKELSEQSSN